MLYTCFFLVTFCYKGSHFSALFNFLNTVFCNCMYRHFIDFQSFFSSYTQNKHAFFTKSLPFRDFHHPPVSYAFRDYTRCSLLFISTPVWTHQSTSSFSGNGGYTDEHISVYLITLHQWPFGHQGATVIWTDSCIHHFHHIFSTARF